ncbi:MAG: M67 family metallopeptidase [Candidatus Thorarchaeota archaeon]|nr:M67 family metallopeptidase [Candidatus Thorarchaeota archaeon]
MEFYLHLSTGELERLHAHAEDSLPFEAVALLFGTIADNRIVVTRVVIVDNISKSRTVFSINPEIQYRLLIEAEEIGDSLVCIFHSHPAPPRPSESDLENMKLNPVVWLIASKETGNWESRAFLLKCLRVIEGTVISSDGAP